MDTLTIEAPDAVSGDWSIETFEVTKQQSDFSRIRSAFGGGDEYCPPGTYKRLKHHGAIVMSNTPMEIRTNAPFIQRAKGSCLITGLCLGMVVSAILKKPEIESVFVIEKSPDVIRLVSPTFENELRVTIVEGDAFTYKLKKGQRFTCAWHDIWTYICSDNKTQAARLKSRFRNRTEWQMAWSDFTRYRW